jgi:hypothetical protein
MASVTTSERHPQVKYGKKYLFSEDPAEKNLGYKLIFIGGGHESRFCLLD